MKDTDDNDYVYIHEYAVLTRRAHHNNGYETICRENTVKLLYCYLNVFETEVPAQDR